MGIALGNGADVDQSGVDQDGQANFLFYSQ